MDVTLHDTSVSEDNSTYACLTSRSLRTVTAWLLTLFSSDRYADMISVVEILDRDGGGKRKKLSYEMVVYIITISGQFNTICRVMNK